MTPSFKPYSSTMPTLTVFLVVKVEILYYARTLFSLSNLVASFLGHCRRSMPDHEFGNFQLKIDDYGSIALHHEASVGIAQLFIEQCHDKRLLPTCREQLAVGLTHGRCVKSVAAVE